MECKDVNSYAYIISLGSYLAFPSCFYYHATITPPQNGEIVRHLFLL